MYLPVYRPIYAVHAATAHLAGILDDPNLSRPQRPPLQHEPALLRLKHRPRLLPRNRRLEHGLVNVRVEFLPGRVKLYDPVPAQRLQQLRPRHLYPRKERCEGGVLGRDRLGHVFQRGGEDVDGREEVLGELLDGVFPCSDFLLVGPFLEVDKVGFAVGQCGLRATSQTRTGFPNMSVHLHLSA
jgi:hypothetical protein